MARRKCRQQALKERDAVMIARKFEYASPLEKQFFSVLMFVEAKKRYRRHSYHHPYKGRRILELIK